MCDTIVALANSTTDGCVLFGKNSDREPNEVQILEYYPHMFHDEDYVKCTYIEIPQVKETYAILLSRPIWMWGGEMGVNEYSVAIGNEAVFTKEPYLEKGLTGMDLIRLALERSRTASQALNIIIDLIEKYGQGGQCGYTKKMYYHNSFIIADSREAWVLETAGKYWVAEKVKDVRSISNCLTIGNKWDKAHPNLINHAIEKGWCRDEDDFNFAKCYSSWFYTYFSKGRERWIQSKKMLEENRGKIDLSLFKSILRSHFNTDFNPAYGSMRDICMHAGGYTRPSQTVGSYIGQLYERTSIHWFTATSAPCLSIYKPVFFEKPYIPEKSEKNFDGRSLWWLHEKIHRKIITNYTKYYSDYSRELLKIDKDIERNTREIREKYLNGNIDEKNLYDFSRQVFAKTFKFIEKWDKKIEYRWKIYNIFYRVYWSKVNRDVKISSHL